MDKEIDIGNGLCAIVDPDDYEALAKYKWHALKKHGIIYARHTSYRPDEAVRFPSVLMHRFILQPPRNKFIDHINGNGLDNRKSNLRICSALENSWNSGSRGGTSKYRGVHWHQIDRRWVASITKDGKKIRIGGFLDEIEAAKAFNKAALELHGEFARLNFIEGVV